MNIENYFKRLKSPKSSMFLRVFSPKLQTPVFNAVLFNTAARHHPACGFCLAEGSKRYFSAAKKKKKKGKRAANVAKNNPGGGIPGEFVMSVTGLSKQVGVRSIFEDVNLGFLQEAKIGILGLNGSGKSTFLKILCGVDDEFDGNLWIKDGLKVGYLPQEPELDPALSVRENVMSGLEKEVFLLKRFDEVSMEMGSDDADFDALLEEQAKLQTEIDNYDAWTLDKRVDMAMEALRVPEEGAEVATLSGGEVRRVALCRLLLERPDMLLLDEPTNHLDAESVEWLEIFLQRYKGTVVAITDDR